MTKSYAQSIAIALFAVLGLAACGGPSNQAPNILSMKATPAQVQPRETTTVEATAIDPEGGDLKYDWSASGDWTIDPDDGSPGTATVTAADSYGSSNDITLEITDPEGSTANETLTLSTPSNNGPLISSLTARSERVPTGGTIDLAADAVDPDNRPLEYNWSVDAEGWSLEPSESEATLQTPDAKGETATVALEIADVGGATARASIIVSTVENSLPVISSLTAQPSRVVPEESAQIAASVSDPDMDDLSYEWSVPTGWTQEGSENQIKVTSPAEYGRSATIGLTVRDGHGGVTTGTVPVATETNRRPTIASLTATPQTVAPGNQTTVKATASDPFDDELTYEWSVPDDWTKDGSGDTIQVTAPDAHDSTGDIELTVKDGHGRSATASVTVSTGENLAPFISSFNANPSSVAPNGTVTLEVRANDPNGDSVTYDWTVPSDWTKTDDRGSEIEVEAPDAYDRTGTFEVTIDDGYGGTVTDTLDVRTARNQAPIVRSLTTSALTLPRQGTATLEVTADDPNGDTLSYSWSISGSGWSITPSSDASEATVTAPDEPTANALVTVTVSDGRGEATDATQNLETEQNNPPRIQKPSSNLLLSDSTNPSPLSHSRTSTYQVDATDSDGDDLTYSLTTSTSATIDSKGGLVSWKPDRSEQGVHTLTVEVTDGYDTVSRNMSFEVGQFALDTSGDRLIPDGSKAFDWSDIDNDGFVDAIYDKPPVFGKPDADLRIAHGSANRFDKPDKYDVPNNAAAWQACGGLASGDIDGDKDIDVMIACEQSPSDSNNSADVSYAIWENIGGTSFQLTTDGVWQATDAYNVNDLELGDLDGDGNLDAAIAAGNHLLVAKNDGNGGFSSYENIHRPDNNSNVSTEFIDAAIGDIDGDGQNDVTVSFKRRYKAAELGVYALDSSGTLDSSQTFQLPSNTETPFQLTLADLDGDGDPDASCLEAQSDKLYTVENDSGTLKQSAEQTFSNVDPYDLPALRGMAVGDYDGDGDSDLATAFNGLSADVVLVFGDGQVGISSTENLNFDSPYSTGIRTLHPADWNDDSETDLLFGTDERLGVAY